MTPAPLRRRAALVIPVVAATMLAVAPAAAGAPPDDAFESARPVAGVSTTAEVALTGATGEAGEPDHAGQGAGTSVWLRWEAPVSAPVTVRATGVGGPVVVAVYTGRSVDALTAVADTGAEGRGGTDSAEARFTARALQPYWLAVDGRRDAPAATSAQVRLLAFAPPDDDLTAARPFAGAAGAVSTSLTHASREVGEPDHGGATGGSVWSTWTAPGDGVLRLTPRGSDDIPPAVGVHVGDAVADLTAVPVRADGNGVDVRVVRGTTYRIALAARSSLGFEHGDATLSWSFHAPHNDRADMAQDVTGQRGRLVAGGSATAEPGEPAHAGQPARRSRWYRWTAPRSGHVEFRTTSPATRLALYQGGAVDDLTALAAQAATGGPVAVTAAVAADEELLLAVDSASTAPVQVAYQLRGPGNDEPAAAQQLPVGSSVTASTHGAGRGATEPAVPGGGGRSAWWTFVAPNGAPLEVQTTGSDFDTALAVYEAGAVPRLVAADDDGGPGASSALRLVPRPGTRYLVAVDGKGGQTGRVALTVGGAVVAVSDVVVDEGAGAATVTFVRWPATGATGVAYRTEPGSAGAADVAARSGEVRFSNRDDSESVTVPIADDELHEAGETFDVVVTPPRRTTAADGGRAAVRILDDDPAPRVAVVPGSVTEGAGAAHVSVTLDRASARPVAVDVATAVPGGAVPRRAAEPGSDYRSAVRTVHVPPGARSASLDVPVEDDGVHEPPEEVAVVPGAVTGAAVSGPSPGALTIVDDEAPPTLSVDDVEMVEGPAGQVIGLDVPVRLSHPSATLVSFDFATANGSAVGPFDYRRLHATAHVEAGELVAPVTIVMRPDNLVEGDEDFFLDLITAHGATIGKARGRILIRDDD